MIGIASPPGDHRRGPLPSEARAVLDRFARELPTPYRARARRWIVAHRVDRALFSAEDAIQQALFLLGLRLPLDIGSSHITTDELGRRFPRILKQVIIDESRSQHASKRYGGGIFR